MSENSFDQIKKLMKIIGGKVVIVEDGKPTMIVMSIDECFDLSKLEDFNFCGKDDNDKIAELNYDINVWKKRQEKRRMKQLENDIKEFNAPSEKNELVAAKEEIIVREL